MKLFKRTKHGSKRSFSTHHARQNLVAHFEQLEPRMVMAGDIALISAGDGGFSANGVSGFPVISDNGQYVAFLSSATDIAPTGVNQDSNLYVMDRSTNTVVNATIGPTGLRGSRIGEIDISGNGRYVVFMSDSMDISNDNNSLGEDLYIKDLQTGELKFAVDNADVPGRRFFSPKLSDDGRYLAYMQCKFDLNSPENARTWIYSTHVKDLLTGITTDIDTNPFGIIGNVDISSNGRYISYSALNALSKYDLFAYDTQNNTKVLISTGFNGTVTDGNSYNASMSADGRFVAFESYATNLLGPASELSYFYARNVYVKDMLTGTLTLANTGSDEYPELHYAQIPSISANGRFISFVANDIPGNIHANIFVKDMLDGTLKRIENANHVTGNGDSYFPVVDNNGSVAFQSDSTNFVQNDTNNNLDIFLKSFEFAPYSGHDLNFPMIRVRKVL